MNSEGNKVTVVVKNLDHIFVNNLSWQRNIEPTALLSLLSWIFLGQPSMWILNFDVIFEVLCRLALASQ